MFGFFPNFNMMMPVMTGNMGNNVNQGMNNPNDIMGLVYGSGQNMNQGNNQSSFTTTKNNIIFKATIGLIVMIPVDLDKTLSDAILLYLRRVDREKLFKKNSGILFLHNAKVIDIYNQTTIRQYFGGFINPTIVVNDVKNLIGAFKI